MEIKYICTHFIHVYKHALIYIYYSVYPFLFISQGRNFLAEG